MKPTVRPSKPYLILSSCHLGVSQDILAVFRTVSEHFGAQVIHLGPIVDESCKSDYDGLTDKIETAEDKLINADDNMRAKTYENKSAAIDVLKHEQENLVASERAMVNMMRNHFPGILFVVPPESMLGTVGKDIKVVENGYELSKYLYLSALAPATERSTVRPFNSKVFEYLRRHGRLFSWIVPHPVAFTRVIPKPGLNNAHAFITVGGLKHVEMPASHKDFHRCSHDPAAVLVCVDSKDGTFHQVRLHIDYEDSKGFKRGRPMVLYDGLRFTAGGVESVLCDDRAVAVGDQHEPSQHDGVVGAIRELIRLLAPATFIDGGDSSDTAPFNRHEFDIPGKMEGRRLIDMMNGLKALWDAETDNQCIKERIMLDSNHHEWLSKFTDKFPQLRGFADWETLHARFFSNWKFVFRKENQPAIIKFGDILLRHGDEESVDKALQVSDGKAILWHTHLHRELHRIVGAGCGCKTLPNYVGNQINSWQNQIVSMTRYHGIANAAAKLILHDEAKKTSRFLFRNQIIEVPFYPVKYERFGK
jgi:hypothetical protein